MSVPSVVFQAYSDTSDFGVDMAIVAASVVRVLNELGVSAAVDPEGSEGTVWAVMYGVPLAAEGDAEACEVLLRAWPSDQWPARPNGVRTVVDFVRYPGDRSRAADHTVAFEDDGTADDVPSVVIWNVLYPLPIEVNEIAKEIVESTVLIHLGQDVTDRLVALRTAIHGFAGLSALGIRYPDGDESAGVVATAQPWSFMASGDVAVVTPEFPFRLAAALRIPAVMVAQTSGEVARATELVARGHSSFLYLGLLSGLTNNQVRDAVRDLRNDDAHKRLMRLGGSEQRADQGVKRIADWVARELVGQGLHRDPYQVKGFDTVFDTFTALPLNASEASEEVEEVPTRVDVFTVDGTWTKPDGAKFIHVRLIGGGGGGGSGRRGAAGTARFGGGGGAGGIANELFIPSSSLPSSVVVTVGAGGSGGPAVSADSTNGSIGTQGGISRFGDFLRSAGFGAAAGQGGTAASGTGGVTDPNVNDHSYLASRGSAAPGAGGNGASSTGNPGVSGARASAGGGGGAAGISAADVSENGGAGALGSPQRGTTIPGGAGGHSTTQNDGFPGTDAEPGNVQGAGGGGGAASWAPTPGNGGAGGFPGGGGGGGAASVNGTNSGAGGQGGNGLVVVTTFF